MHNSLGLYLRSKRRDKQMTLRDLAAKTGIDFSMISKYENGIIKPPQEKLRLIASALNVPYEELQLRANIISSFTNILGEKTSNLGRSVIVAAQGRCELCNNTFPDGELFLEAHHVVLLKDGGSKNIDNLVALCPNCHKRVQIYNDPRDIAVLLQAAKSHV